MTKVGAAERMERPLGPVGPHREAAGEAEREFVRGLELHRAEQLDQALRYYAKAASLDPDHAMAWNNMGVVLRRQGKRTAALACYRRATAIAADEPSHQSNLGNVLRDLGMLDEAERHGARAVALAPENAGAHHNYGLILQDLGRHAEAVASFDEAIRLEPGNVSFRWDRALNLLMAGDLARGFMEYQVRWKLPQNPPPNIAAPEWTGEPLVGKTILIWAEQGFGDTLQFIRYAPLLKERGAGRVILLAQPALARLLVGAKGVDSVVTEGTPKPLFDCHAPLLCLPRLFGTSLQTVPAECPYLKVPADPGLRLRRPEGVKLAVGICWAGKSTHRNDRNRSAGIEPFLTLMDDPQIAFYSLQKGSRAADLLTSGAAALAEDLSSRINDFTDTARFMQQLDLVISVDTAVAHLAGALGIPVWVAIPATIDWRWMRSRADSPWYPSMRLFRQRRSDDWTTPFAEMKAALEEAIGEARNTAAFAAPAPVNPEPSKPKHAKVAPVAAKSAEDTLLVPSVFMKPDGGPRFVMPIPRRVLADAGIGYLVRHETQFGGYEYPTRCFLARHLQPGDLFIDVGAHWGLYALTAATRWPGEVAVLAIEPESDNLRHLQDWIIRNGVAQDVAVVAAAAGAQEGTVTFARNSTMGHSVVQPGAETPLGTFSARMTTIDAVLRQHPDLQDRRTFLKIDVEGHEPEVIEGARTLIESGRVEALIWERGRAYDDEPHRGRLIGTMSRLAKLGYAHYRFPHETLGGPLLPYLFNHELVNVLSLGPNFLRHASYARPPGPYVAPNRPSSVAFAPEERRRWTRALITAQSTDGARWADPANLKQGAEERARRAAVHIADGSHILDLGAGLMMVRDFAPADIRYVPADLVLRDPAGIVVDLNSGDFPPGSYDGVVMLELLEYMHDPHAVLAMARMAAHRLLLSYRLHDGGDTGERRTEGIFNDFTRTQLLTVLEATDWKVVATEEGPGYTLFLCRAVSPAAKLSEGDGRARSGWAERLGLGRR
ncbi:MAG TPA: FkbM family methyltransferase [Alphaproteobacteria bacterium]|nr:FkbM family methyltransferase [Alphaproteobacteria bacterium]